jgi:hypothetical protein
MQDLVKRLSDPLAAGLLVTAPTRLLMQEAASEIERLRKIEEVARALHAVYPERCIDASHNIPACGCGHMYLQKALGLRPGIGDDLCPSQTMTR